MQKPDYMAFLLRVSRSDRFHVRLWDTTKILDWSSKHISSINPEVDIAAFPPDYRFVKSWQFEGVLRCPDFECLARQLWSVILDSTLNLKERHCAVEFLKDQLPKPEISIRQQLRTYIR